MVSQVLSVPQISSCNKLHGNCAAKRTASEAQPRPNNGLQGTASTCALRSHVDAIVVLSFVRHVAVAVKPILPTKERFPPLGETLYLHS